MQEYDPTTTEHWQLLTRLARRARTDRILGYFDQDPERCGRYSLTLGGLFVDFSKHRIDDEILRALVGLAESSPLGSRRDAMFRGEMINVTEERAVLHSALRDPDGAFAGTVKKELKRMGAFCDQVRSGEWRGYSDQRITDVVNIGIGGSDLGPKMACVALEEFAQADLSFHFVSNVDGAPMRSLLARLDPASTLFVVCSKSFTTQETMLNAATAIQWFQEKTGLASPMASPHFIAVTSSPENAAQRGIPNDQILEFWDWVGGRYSLWSTIGVTICLMIGPDRFNEFLAGARQMDEHFLAAPPSENLPILLALVGIWYSNFLDAETAAVVPYCERLSFLPAYLQQLDMESNGKAAALDGRRVSYHTGPIIWGQTGTNGQHAFFQLLHQGTRLVPVDFIGVIQDSMSSEAHHRVLLANMIAQSAALMSGEDSDNQHKHYPPHPGAVTVSLRT